MNEKEAEQHLNCGENEEKPVKTLYGLEPEMSLQSLKFAPNENSLLNEHFEGEE
ncbi:hypothetical protein J1P26_03970 [Neobacillus sp. MM2021_6]|uniref:hypothetical protein n=1 Tax=Bacillaceae TaxID=186817 RepID=UPI00140B1C54|nr:MULTISPECIES: hypothetical protein [Bacillaceae]MBO0958878.1 hypothetical protein [Neobacillus sp. MM2021_6]NHC17607.1 hypothetical protein [Bacillus sp. MM2020_4]